MSSHTLTPRQLTPRQRRSSLLKPMVLPRIEDLDDDELLEADEEEVEEEEEATNSQLEDDDNNLLSENDEDYGGASELPEVQDEEEEGSGSLALGGAQNTYGLTSSSQDVAGGGGSAPTTPVQRRGRTRTSPSLTPGGVSLRGGRRGVAATSQGSPYLPLPRQVSDSPALIASRFTPSLPDPGGATTTVDSRSSASTTGGLRGNDGAAINSTSSESSDDDGEEDDKLAAYFGYQRNDAMVPKAAYDAVVHRVRDLETSLGETNGTVRSYSHRIAELEGSIEHYLRQLQQKEKEEAKLLRCMDERERQMNLRERELLSREQAVEALAHQQRKMLLRKRTGSDKISSTGNDRSLELRGATSSDVITGSMSDSTDLPPSGLHERQGRRRDSFNALLQQQQLAHSVVTPSQESTRAGARLPRIAGARPPSPDRFQSNPGGGNRSHSSMI